MQRIASTYNSRKVSLYPGITGLLVVMSLMVLGSIPHDASSWYCSQQLEATALGGGVKEGILDRALKYS